ncbi:MAG: TIGR03862 family flavoprotein [Proteobacteria bacterium]|nr:TIGR03862 family flavoprotein [Pseudomonadota bacterium]
METNNTHSIAIIGAGPAGLMAAESAIQGGGRVDVYDGMASVGRKFLLAGKGGLNLTHAEPMESFLSRFGSREANLRPIIEAFGPADLREWAQGLGIGTFVGSSGRVFPTDQKAAPLLRAWLHRLRKAGVVFHSRHRWQGWNEEGGLCFDTPQGTKQTTADALILALGGGSWPRLGSDGAWVPILSGRGVTVAPLRPSNCGFDYPWSEHFRTRFAGQPVKTVAASFTDAEGEEHVRVGEFIVTATGVEGQLIYALSAALRDTIETIGIATPRLDLTPGRDLKRLIHDLSKPRGSASMAKHLQKRAGIDGVKAGLLRELADPEDFTEPSRLAAVIKSLPLRLKATRPLDEAISTAGGGAFEALDGHLMVRALPGVFCAGEMLDWEAPTGGYLLTACFATGRAAGLGAVAWLES